jgi:hypothetical protein
MTHRFLPIRRVGLALAFATLALPGFAQEIFECSFEQKPDNYGYLSPTLVLAREPDSETATVVDVVIQQEAGGPIEVKIAEENDRKLSMTWEVKVVSPENRYLRLSYRLSIQKSSLSATLSAKPQGYSNSFSARGACKLGRL